MIIRAAEPLDQDQLAQLLADYRVTMCRFRGSAPPPDLPTAARELLSYEPDEYQIHLAESDEGSLVAFIICRIIADHVSVEALYVVPEYRRQGLANLLYDQAEALAEELGGEPITNWVHPNNDRFIAFLRKRGYLVLSQIELRKPSPAEGPMQQIRVGTNIFEYCC